MKKFISFTLLTVMCIALLTGCNRNSNARNNTGNNVDGKEPVTTNDGIVDDTDGIIDDHKDDRDGEVVGDNDNEGVIDRIEDDVEQGAENVKEGIENGVTDGNVNDNNSEENRTDENR